MASACSARSNERGLRDESCGDERGLRDGERSGVSGRDDERPSATADAVVGATHGRKPAKRLEHRPVRVLISGCRATG